MTITRTTVPCTGVLLEDVTGDDMRFGLLVSTADHRHFYFYGCGLDDSPAVVVMDADDADEIDDLLHMRPTPYRLARIEQRINELAADPRLR